MRMPTGSGARLRFAARLLAVALAALAGGSPLFAQAPDAREIAARLRGLDASMEKILKDWNAPGIGVGVVVGDRLVFAKGYGYRDYDKKLPFTPATVYQIASNYEAVHGRGRRHAGRRGKADLGQAGPRVGPRDPVLQRPAQQHGHAARHAVASNRDHPPRHDLVQVRLHAQAAVREAQVPGAEGADADDLPLQQPDVRGRRVPDRAESGQDLGGLRPGPHLQAARDGRHALRDFRHGEAARPRRGLSRRGAIASSSTTFPTTRTRPEWRPRERSSRTSRTCRTG